MHGSGLKQVQLQALPLSHELVYLSSTKYIPNIIRMAPAIVKYVIISPIMKYARIGTKIGMRRKKTLTREASLFLFKQIKNNNVAMEFAIPK